MGWQFARPGSGLPENAAISPARETVEIPSIGKIEKDAPSRRFVGVNHLTLPALAAFVAAAASCAPTHPHRASASQPVIRGELVDAKTTAPIARQPVQITVDGQPFKRTTSAQGGWRVPLAKIHNDVRSEAKVIIDCPGYSRETVNWSRRNEPARKSPDSANINLGTIRLNKR